MAETGRNSPSVPEATDFAQPTRSPRTPESAACSNSGSSDGTLVPIPNYGDGAMDSSYKHANQTPSLDRARPSPNARTSSRFASSRRASRSSLERPFAIRQLTEVRERTDPRLPPTRYATDEDIERGLFRQLSDISFVRRQSQLTAPRIPPAESALSPIEGSGDVTPRDGIVEGTLKDGIVAAAPSKETADGPLYVRVSFIFR
jgi:hypothetical protein